MANALPHVEGDLFQLDERTLQRGIEASRASARRRMILPLHRQQEAPVQRMLNFFQPGTYVRPHLHPLDGAIETIHVLRGRLGFCLFDEEGRITERFDLRADGLGLIDIEPRIWHGMVALESDTVILEIKQGPYCEATDKVFAEWAPAEGASGFKKVTARLEAAFS